MQTRNANSLSRMWIWEEGKGVGQSGGLRVNAQSAQPHPANEEREQPLQNVNLRQGNMAR